MKIAFAGPSGSGKTTLVKYIEEDFKLKWLNGSSGQLKTEQENKTLTELGLKVGGGHQQVIQSGHANPEAAWLNQDRILTNRANLFADNDNFVTDRSPIDVLVYATIQCGPYVDDHRLTDLVKDAFQACKHLTHIIYIPTMLYPIENNGSRITNYLYQKAMGKVFEMYLEMMEQELISYEQRPQVIRITTADLAQRKRQIADYLRYL